MESSERREWIPSNLDDDAEFGLDDAEFGLDETDTELDDTSVQFTDSSIDNVADQIGEDSSSDEKIQKEITATNSSELEQDDITGELVEEEVEISSATLNANEREAELPVENSPESEYYRRQEKLPELEPGQSSRPSWPQSPDGIQPSSPETREARQIEPPNTSPRRLIEE